MTFLLIELKVLFAKQLLPSQKMSLYFKEAEVN